jgi:hypothetical protein
LIPEIYQLDELTVLSTNNNDQHKGINISKLKILQTPTLFGESDILKTILTIAGVKPISEGNNGFSVRGGAPNQNLVLLDEVPVYNLNHLFGFISLINSDAIKNVQFYKSYIPAKYGGRLSSVLDIDLYDGNNETLKKELSIGLISSRFKIDGPLSSKATFSLNARASYLGLFLLPTYFSFKNGNKDQYFNYWLYDFSTKIKYSLNNKSTLTLGIYNGDDIWNTRSGASENLSKQNTNWGNFSFSGKYQKIINEKTFLNTQLIYSNYYQRISQKENTSQSNDPSGIKTHLFDIGFKNSIEYFQNANSKTVIGMELINHNLTPSQDINIKKSKRLSGFSNSIFIDQEKLIMNRLQLNLGIRGVNYYIQEKHYNVLEPRFYAGLKINKSNSFFMSYVKMTQFLHQISSNSIGLPIDIWITSNRDIPPQRSEQYSLGYSLKRTDFGIMMEFFNKKYNNLLDFKNGASLFNISDSNYLELIEGNGIGKAYGLEFQINKVFDRFSTELAYTYSVSKMKIENINNNNWYFSPYDRRHSLVSNFNFTLLKDKIFLTNNFVLYSGSPTTIPDAVINSLDPMLEWSNNSQLIYTSKNNFRFPLYHRSDFSVSIKGKTKFHKEKTWNFGIYNLYNRINPFYLDVKKVYVSPNTYTLDFVKVGILPILPFISYSLKW